MRLLWSLPKAVPAMLRHLAGYAELAGQDLEQTQRDFGARLFAAVLLGLSVFFVIFCACLLVVALSWDTAYRVAAILWMGGLFVLLAVIAAVYRSKVLTAQSPLLGTVRRAWEEDRVILDHILSPDENQ